MKIFSFIFARGGSKDIKNKNIVKINGKPLIFYSILLAKKISGKIYYEYDMKHLNWFNLGGPAKIFFKPNTLEELVILLKKAHFIFGFFYFLEF